MKYPVLIDTSAFHALENSGDIREHGKAKQVAGQLESDGAILVTTDYILDETYSLLRMALGHKNAVAFGREIRRGGIAVVQIDETIQKEAWKVFQRYADKDFSFTDCTSFIAMERGKMQRVFTFDRHFQQYGFMTLPAKLPPGRK